MSGEPLASGPQDMPIFDHQRALAMLADDVDLLVEVLGTFVEHVPVQLVELHAAIASRDFAEAERLAHGVKGAALNVHAQRIRRKAAEMEASARIHDIPSMQAQYDQLMDEMRVFEAHLKNFDWTTLRGR